MIEVGNKILQDVLRKGGDSEDGLRHSTRYVNSRTIEHFKVAPREILLGVPPSLDLSELWKPTTDNDSVLAHVASLSNPTEHGRLLRQYITYRAELHDEVAQASHYMCLMILWTGTRRG